MPPDRIVHSTQRAIVGQSRRDNYLFKRLATTRSRRARRRSAVSECRRPEALRHPARPPVDDRNRRVRRDRRGDRRSGHVSRLLPHGGRRPSRRDLGLSPRGGRPVPRTLARQPINESAQGNPILTIAQRTGGTGFVNEPLETGGPTFVNGYRLTTTPPLVVAISLSLDDILEDWRHQRRISSLAFGALGLTFAGIVLVLFRQVNATDYRRARAD